jgi:iron complex outermembrane recepter protein
MAIEIRFLPAACRSVCAVLLMLGAPVVFAQQTTSAPAAPSTGGLDEIVVTARKQQERLQDVPITIAELSGAQLQSSGVTTASDLPSLVSGLVWSNQGAWIEPNIRGSYTSVAAVGSQSPIAIYLDGVYQPMQAGTIADLPDVDRVEVLKGPQGTLFGRNATGGAISIYTLDPSFTPTGSFSLQSGLYGGGSSENSGHYRGTAFFSGPLIDDTLAGSISTYYDTTDGYFHDDVTGGRAGHISAEGVRAKLLWKPIEGVSFVTTFYYSHRDDGAAESALPFDGITTAKFYPGAIVPSEPWHIAYNGEPDKADITNEGASIKGTFEFDSGTLTSITGYSRADVHSLVDVNAAYSPACVAAGACLFADLVTSNNSYTQEFDFASKPIGPFRYVAGLFGFYNVPKEVDAYDGFQADGSVVKNISYAAFAEGTYDVTDSLSAIAGVRVNKDILRANGYFEGEAPVNYADKDWTSTTPRGSLVYKINPIVNAYFTYSKGFKAGIVSGTPTTAPPANPEKLSAYEVGIKAAQQNYSVNLAAFYYDYTDLQIEVFNIATLTTVPENAAKAKVEGLDLDGAYKFGDAFELRADTSFLPTAKYTSFPMAVAYLPPIGPNGLTTVTNYNASGSRMLTTPRFTGTLTGIYRRTIAAGNLEANASIYHSSDYRWEYTGVFTTAAYSLVNAQVSFTPTSTNVKYSLYGKNLNNAAYVQGALPTADAYQALYAPPREVGVRLDYSF